MFNMLDTPPARTNSRRRIRRAGVVVELLLTLPVLFIALLAIVEFGLILANVKQVALASREGAKLAAETAPLNGGTAAVIRNLVDDRLESAGMGTNASQGVTLQDTVTFGTFTDGDCPAPAAPPLPLGAVRVTVCVELEKLSPNLLQAFGFDISGLVVEHTTTYRHEL